MARPVDAAKQSLMKRLLKDHIEAKRPDSLIREQYKHLIDRPGDPLPRKRKARRLNYSSIVH